MLKALSILLLFISISSSAQSNFIGAPNVRNYPKSDYNAGTQNWAISQDQNGFIYAANNDGLLCFNGVKWDLIQISSSLPLRSICVDSSNTVYVGMINDFGLIEKEQSYKPVFKSLKYLLPEGYEEFDDVWRIYEVEDGVVFQSFKYLFLYKNDRITIIEAQNSFLFSFKIGNRLFLQEPDLGVFELSNGNLIKLSFWDKHKEKDISSILETGNNQLLIGTSHDGIFVLENNEIRKWNTAVSDFTVKNSLYCGINLPGNYYVFGTILDGLVISDIDGNIIKTLNINQGLQNNTVLSLFVDSSDGLWLGLDNGIDYIDTNSPLSYIGSKKLGTGYCCIIFEENLYLGTNQGLFVMPINKSGNNRDFQLVENTGGQVWSLEEFDGELICGHSKGTFKIVGQSAEIISTEEGAWKYISIKDNPEFLIGGHYQGLVLLKKNNNEWEFSEKIKGFEESSRYLTQDEYGDLWIGHGGKGIFRVSLSKDLSSVEELVHYTSQNGLPSLTGNILFTYKRNIYVSTKEGNYQFDRTTDSFIPSILMDKLLGNSGKVKSVATDNEGNTWYIAENESGVIRQNDDKTSTINTIPLKKLHNKYVHEFEFVYPFDNESVFIGVEDGFVHYSLVFQKSYRQAFKAFITSVELYNIDSVLYIGENNSNKVYEFPFRRNSFRFHFAAPFFENETPLKFSYFLEGFSDNWSDWSDEIYKDFTSLHEGDYRLQVKSKNIYGIESEHAFFDFEITPPRQRSNVVYFVYILLLLTFLFLIIKYIQYRIKKSLTREEQRHLEEIQRNEEQFQRSALVAEKEIINLRNEKLSTDMVYRNKELANQTMEIIQKNKFLIRVKEDLNSIQDFIINDKAKEKICGLKARIKKEVDIKQQSKIFETYFDEVHEEFFKLLKERYSDLTTNDLRLCAFIKMNISTKEIATILNISYRGAEVSRYRLRKKMNLSREVNLSAFLASI